MRIAESRNKSILEHIEIIGERNYQTKFLCGAKSLEERTFHAGKEDLEKAKTVLKEDYDFVGLVEKFNSSLIFMKELEVPELDIRYQRKNVTKNKPVRRSALSEKIEDKLREVHKIDYQLYEFTREKIFKNYKNKYSERSIEEKLDQFEKSINEFHFKKQQLLKYRVANHLAYKPFLSVMRKFS